MLIQKPNSNKIKFLIPEVIDAVDITSEPSLEGITGIDLAGESIDVGGVIAGVWDGRPQFKPEIITDLITGPDSTFESDTGNWVRGASVTITGGALAFTATTNGAVYSKIPPITGVTYEVEYEILTTDGDDLRIVVGGTNGTTHTSTGVKTQDIIAGAGGTVEFEVPTDPLTATVGYIKVRHKGVWGIDAALERRPRRGLDFALLHTHNLLDVYTSALREIVDFYSAPTDALPADPIAASRYLAGLLGEGGPFVSLDGFNDYVTVADDPNLNFGANSDFSLSCLFRTTQIGSVGKIIQKGNSSGAWYGIFLNSDGTIQAVIDDGATSVFPLGTTLVNDGQWHRVVATFNRAGKGVLYLDGVAEDTDSITGVGDIDDTGEPLAFGIDADSLTDQPFDGDISEVLIYNRALAPKEIEQMALGTPVPEPFDTFLYDNGTFGTVGDWTAQGLATVTGGYDSGDSGHETTLRIEAGSTSGNAASLVLASQVIGRRYRLSIDYKYTNITDRPATSPLAQIGGINIITAPVVTSWNTVSEAFTATLSGDLWIYVNRDGAGHADNELLIDNVYLTDLDTLVTFPLVVDQWGAGALSTSTLVNVDYDLFINETPTGFDALSGSDNFTEAGTVDEVSFISGETYTVRFNEVLNSGQFPDISIRDALNGSHISVGGTQTSKAGSNVIKFVCNSTTTGVVQFANNLQTNYEITKFRIQIDGAVAVYQPDGISVSQGLWLDASRNLLHGTIVGADIWNAPTPDNHGYFLQEFQESIADRYLFTRFNPDALAALDTTFLGWLMWGSTYTWDYLDTGGYSASIGSEGIKSSVTDTGILVTEKLFGLRPGWSITFIPQTPAGWQQVQDMLSILVLRLFPFYIIWDSEDSDPALWQVRLSESVPFERVQGSDRDGTAWEGIQLNILSEGI